MDMPVTVPCGRCIGCRLERARQWAIRLMHENSLHAQSMYVTLTYDNKHVPVGGTLVKAHFQKFMKRFRKRCGSPVRYFHCGEYGGNTARPHYHALIFGARMPDMAWRKRNRQGNDLYTSDALDALWTHGECLIGEVTFESCAYVARYICDKVTGDAAANHYSTVDVETGEIFQRLPEYITMSNAIGKGWYEKFKSDVFPGDGVAVRGGRFLSKPPRYYDKRLEAEEPEEYRRVKARRERAAKKQAANSTPERLAVRHTVARARVGLKSRGDV